MRSTVIENYRNSLRAGTRMLVIHRRARFSLQIYKHCLSTSSVPFRVPLGTQKPFTVARTTLGRAGVLGSGII